MTRSAHRDTSALVIGGTQGLGLAITQRLRSEGCTRLVIAGRNASRGEAAAEASGATYLPVDLADTGAAVRLVDEAAERMGRVDALVNAAALTDRGSILDTTPDLWDRIMTANVRSPFFTIQRVAQRAIDGGFPVSVVNILSVAAHCGQSLPRPLLRVEGGARQRDQECRPGVAHPPNPGERDQLRLDGHARRGCDSAQVPTARATTGSNRPKPRSPSGCWSSRCTSRGSLHTCSDPAPA